tara:strand:- start:13104 stop:13988 length:885 start_codon:yes stop_codon:yes gene_type:complete
MLNILLQLFPIILPIFIITLLGYLWNKFNNNLNEQEIIKLITWIGAPTLIFNTLINSETSSILIKNITFIAILMTLIMLILSFLILKLFKEPIRPLINPMTFQNSGNLGLTVCLFAFGKIGLELSIIYFMITSVLHFTLGLTIWSGKLSIKYLLKAPVIYAVLLGLIINYNEIQLPKTISNTTSVLAGITIPLLLFTMGTSISKIKFNLELKIILLAIIRSIIALTLAYLLTMFFNIGGIAQKIILIQGVLPAPIFTYLFASQYKVSPEKVANYLMTSTLISIITITIFLTIII